MRPLEHAALAVRAWNRPRAHPHGRRQAARAVPIRPSGPDGLDGGAAAAARAVWAGRGRRNDTRPIKKLNTHKNRVFPWDFDEF